MSQPYPNNKGPAPVPTSPDPSHWSPAPGGAAGPSPRKDAGFFRAMFDFTFEHFITVRFSSFIYVLAFIMAGLYWMAQIVTGVLMGFALGADAWTEEQGFNAVPLVLSVLFGWIPSVILLIAMRLGLEFAVATVRTAQNTRRIADATEARA